MKSGDLVWRKEVYLSGKEHKLPAGPVLLLEQINFSDCWLANIGIYTWKVLEANGEINQYTTVMLTNIYKE